MFLSTVKLCWKQVRAAQAKKYLQVAKKRGVWREVGISVAQAGGPGCRAREAGSHTIGTRTASQLAWDNQRSIRLVLEGRTKDNDHERLLDE
jgi:hypothetical protein